MRPIEPLDRSNRYLRLPAAFSRADGSFSQSVGYGNAEWRGFFDAAYTKVGDYLVQDDNVWFVAAQPSLLPVLCIKTNRVISIAHQPTPFTGSPNAGDVIQDVTLNVISRWPASLLGVRTEGKSPTRLPGDTAVPSAIALLPSSDGQLLQPTDIVTDDLGTSSIVVAAELSDLGWRLNIRHVST